ncbi:MAG: hypothetical protein KAH03_01830 [Cocleimonas sp.]|nr:hypothetical protein [Cocleimonas sp.]
MSINKPTAYLLTAMIILMATLQISQAQETALVAKNNAKFDHIVNIVDPAMIAGTETLLKDLI